MNVRKCFSNNATIFIANLKENLRVVEVGSVVVLSRFMLV